MSDSTPLHETPPETAPSGAEASFLTSFQVRHPQYSLTEIRSVLRHVGLRLALEQEEDWLHDAVHGALQEAKE